MADPPITPAVREGNALANLKEAIHESNQDMDIALAIERIVAIEGWAEAVTELINRELVPVVAANRGFLNARHGGYEKLTADGAIDDFTEFLECDGVTTATLPLIANHLGPIYVRCDNVTTFQPPAASGETINGLASVSFANAVLFNDGASNWLIA